MAKLHNRNHKAPEIRVAGRSTNTTKARQSSPDAPVTTEQRMFAKYVAQGDSVGNAAARAGFSTVSLAYHYRLLAMPKIQRIVEEERQLAREAALLSKRDVMDMLKEAYDMAKLMSEPATMVASAREIGKMCGYYEPKKVQVDVNMSGSVKFEQLTDQQLFEMIEKAAAQAAAEEEGDDQVLLEGPQSPPGDDFVDV